MDIDMSEFTAIFVEEAQEHLQEMEASLLALRIETVTTEELNKIFRAAHSIKGGSATFGLTSVTGLAHVLETLLDKLRSKQLAITCEMVDALLQGTDSMGALIAQCEGRGEVDAQGVERLCEWVRRLCDGEAAAEVASAPASAPEPAAAAAAAAAAATTTATTTTTTQRAKPSAASQVEGVAFGFFGDDALNAQEAQDAQEANVQAQEIAAVPMARTESEAPAQAQAVALAAPAPAPVAQTPQPVLASAPSAAAPAVAPAQAAAAPSPESSSIRVSVEKVDQIINLVGELVITQSMLAQHAHAEGHDPRLLLEKLKFGLDQLDRNTRGLQEAAMAMRMMPISAVFNRFPRVVRDVAARLGKQVELKLVGEGTELDKGLIERIVDPLTHLVRNSLDHGLESPAERIALGKPAVGTITLRASHQGGNIVIEVSDDGRGLSRERILAKAHERGIPVPEHPSDAEVWNLIFEAGFSTAAQVTDVSGRGVGMDVVRSNILGLGGRVEIDSVAGQGSRMTVRLPLTLAILDGMSVSCGGEVFILPLAFIVESLRPGQDAVRTIRGSGRVLQIRGKYLPVVALHELMGIEGAVHAEHEGILVVLETEDTPIALFVDALLGQHQVVIKSLETHYRKVPGVSGATIMGDGRVALILDASGLWRMAGGSARALPVPSASSSSVVASDAASNDPHARTLITS